MADIHDPVKQVPISSSLVEYIKAMIWPVFALVILVAFWNPLHDLAVMLPKMLAQSESITWGSVTVTMSKSSAEKIPADVRQVINDLQSDDIRQILTDGEGTILFEKPDDQVAGNIAMNTWKRLVKLGLASELSKIDLASKSKADGSNYSYGVETTEKYPRVRNAIIEFTILAVQQPTITKQPSNKASAR